MQSVHAFVHLFYECSCALFTPVCAIHWQSKRKMWNKNWQTKNEWTEKTDNKKRCILSVHSLSSWLVCVCVCMNFRYSLLPLLLRFVFTLFNEHSVRLSFFYSFILIHIISFFHSFPAVPVRLCTIRLLTTTEQLKINVFEPIFILFMLFFFSHYRSLSKWMRKKSILICVMKNVAFSITKHKFVFIRFQCLLFELHSFHSCTHTHTHTFNAHWLFWHVIGFEF